MSKMEHPEPIPKPQEAAKEVPDAERRECREGEVLCGQCGYPAVLETGIGEDGKPYERLLPHYGKHEP